MNSRSGRWKIYLGIFGLLVFCSSFFWYGKWWEKDLTLPKSEDSNKLSISTLRLKPLTVSLREDALTNLNISLEVVFVGNLHDELNTREGELRAEFVRHLTNYEASRVLNDFQEGFLSKDLERISNKLLGLSSSESRVINVFVESLHFGYSPISFLSQSGLVLASSGAFLADAQTTLENIKEDARFDNTSTGSSTQQLGMATLDMFTVPVLEWPSRTLTLEVEVLCSDFKILEIFERRGELRQVTISHISKYSPSQINESFLDGTLQERLRRLYHMHLRPSASEKSAIHSVYFPTFHMSYSVATPNNSQEGKKMFFIEEYQDSTR
ncbi:TPA: hypothetical protein HA234_01360 [Candidatus Woesearchaeota archaeon]|nr:hypothetical protein [Candidatus Woesearchaeota archaeon]